MPSRHPISYIANVARIPCHAVSPRLKVLQFVIKQNASAASHIPLVSAIRHDVDSIPSHGRKVLFQPSQLRQLHSFVVLGGASFGSPADNADAVALQPQLVQLPSQRRQVKKWRSFPIGRGVGGFQLRKPVFHRVQVGNSAVHVKPNPVAIFSHIRVPPFRFCNYYSTTTVRSQVKSMLTKRPGRVCLPALNIRLRRASCGRSLRT